MYCTRCELFMYVRNFIFTETCYSWEAQGPCSYSKLNYNIISVVTGFIENRQCPMSIGHVGNDLTEGFLNGYMDEVLRFYIIFI